MNDLNAILKFIYSPFMENNNIKNRTLNFLEEFSTDLFKKFIEIQVKKIGLNEQISLEKLEQNKLFSLEYDCKNNILELKISYLDNGDTLIKKLTTFIQLKQIIDECNEISFPSMDKTKITEVSFQKQCSLILSEINTPKSAITIKNNNGQALTNLNPTLSTKIIICTLNNNDEISKNIINANVGIINLLDDSTSVIATQYKEEVFESETLYKLDFEKERHICNSIVHEANNALLFEENISYESIDKGLYQLVNYNTEGESAYFGDCVNQDKYYIRKYDPNDKGTYNFESKKSQMKSLTKEQFLNVQYDENYLKNLILNKFDNVKE